MTSAEDTVIGTMPGEEVARLAEALSEERPFFAFLLSLEETRACLHR